MLLHVMETALASPTLIENWRDTLKEWTEASEEQRAAIFDWTMAMRDQFLEASRDIDDPETLDMVLAVRYIEMKSHWILLNTQINYGLASKGEADMNLAYRASLISQLLEALELLIEPEDIDRIIDFLSEPLSDMQALAA
jgi:hypothetical protein